tara:strand:+ start:1143 stop:1805 length:663 start_codon:yes stop_codon:yes gene_type:complete
MCGRFININKVRRIKKIFDIKNNLLESNDLISYNIAPNHNTNIVIYNNYFQIKLSNWGINFFDKKNNVNRSIINSRLETINQKKNFQNSYFNKKCIIPSNGYYEWQNKNGIKIPYLFQISELETFFFPGIWKFSIVNECKIMTFSIITKKSNNNISSIHERMPVIMDINEAKNYILNDNEVLDINFISNLEDLIDFYPVSKFVNSPINNTKECIKAINYK